MTTATDKQAPAWERFHEMSTEVHGILIGAAQCRNHLRATLEAWGDMNDAERWQSVNEALHRLTRVGI